MSTLSAASMRHFNPLNDYLFYKVMGEKGDEGQLLGFLNAVLGRTGKDQFTSVEILENKTFTPEVLGDKSVTFDIRAVLKGDSQAINPRVNVEVQLRNRHNMDKRSLFYWSREFVKSLKAGENYRELPDVIGINIVDFDFLPTQNYHTCFHLREDQEPHIILTNSLEIHYINMVKYRRAFSSQLDKKGIFNDPLCRWLAWFNESSPPEILAEVTRMDNGIQLADDRLVYLTGDEDAIRAYEMRFKAMCDWTSDRDYAIETGFAEGMEKGLEQGMAEGKAKGMAEGKAEGKAEGIKVGHEEEKLKIARKMKAADRPQAEIMQFTGLSLKAIQKL
jgi:predicted transposase/invertase (TIGR01784 family)